MRLLTQLLILFAFVASKVHAFEPFTIAAGAAAIASMIVIPTISRFYCNMTECCDDHWLTWNISGMFYSK